MNQKSKRFSLTNLSYVEEMKLKLQKSDLIQNTTDAMIIQFDLHPKTDIKRKTSIQQKSSNSIFNLYRPLIKIVSGYLFFDDGENRAEIHRCNRKQVNRKFTMQDLASIHRREFYIINYNFTCEQRFINLYKNLF